MGLTIDLTADEAKRFETAGIDVTNLLKGIAASLSEGPVVQDKPRSAQIDAKSAAAIAYLQERMNSAITDPDEVRMAESDLGMLQQRLNENRIASGERPLFPQS